MAEKLNMARIYSHSVLWKSIFCSTDLKLLPFDLIKAAHSLSDCGQSATDCDLGLDFDEDIQPHRYPVM